VKLQGETRFEAAPQQVWDVLLDAEVMAACIPGCKSLTEIEPDRYKAVLKVGIGPVSGTYEGSFHVYDQQAPERYTMAFQGDGGPGFVKGVSRTELRPDGDATIVGYECDLEVGGLIASVGQRVISSASSFLVKQMFSKLREQVARRAKG